MRGCYRSSCMTCGELLEPRAICVGSSHHGSFAILCRQRVVGVELHAEARAALREATQARRVAEHVPQRHERLNGALGAGGADVLNLAVALLEIADHAAEAG